MMFEFAEEKDRLADIKVVGVGGAGGNAVGRMIEAGLSGVAFIAINTDLQALQDSRAHHPMQIGAKLTKGLGSGGDPGTGMAAAEEDRETIASALEGADMVFVTAGMGGGTGTGAAPIIAGLARDQGALTVGIITKPFQFEGRVRMEQAEEGIRRLQEAVDTLIIIPNQRLLEVVPPDTSMQEAFRIADNVLYEATRGIYEIITRHDHVNLDFADVRSVMKGMGVAIMGTGRAEGEDRAVAAAKMAISSPLLENVDILGSQAVLVNVLGREVGLQDTAAAMQFIQEAAGPQAHVIFGYGSDESLGDTLQITVIATGFSDQVADASWQEARQQTLLSQSAARVEPAAGHFTSGLEAEPQPQLEPDKQGDQLLEAADKSEESSAADQLGELQPAAELVEEFEPEPVAQPEPPQEDGFLVRPSPEEPVARLGSAQLSAAEDDLGKQGGYDQGTGRFLQPVGRRSIGEVEVPDLKAKEENAGKPAAVGWRPQQPTDDLNAPAYTRKYMD